MNVLASLVTQVLHIILVCLAAPTLGAVVRALADRLTGREGPPVSQPWHELLMLFRKQPVHADNASAVVRLAPLLSFAVAAVCVVPIPSFALGMALAPLADLFTIAALLALGSAILALAAMDAGTGEGGVAAARSTNLAVYAEPALLLAILGLSLLAGGSNLDQIVGAEQEGLLLPAPAAALAVAAIAVLGWSETARPALDHAFSARDLALVRAAGHLRVIAWCDLVGALALPLGIAPAGAGLGSWGIGLLAWVVKLLLFAFVLAGVRTFALPQRLPSILTLALLLGTLAAVLGLIGVGAT